MTSETLAMDKGNLVLKFSVTVIAYSHLVLGMNGLFGTKANLLICFLLEMNCKANSQGVTKIPLYINDVMEPY